jgi:hypothetical protein
MQITFFVNGNKNIFKSKSAKKKLRELLKKHSFSDLRTYWNKFKVRCDNYINDNVLFSTQFTKNEEIELTFKEYKSLEDKKREVNKHKLRKLLADKKKGRQNQGDLNIIEEELKEWDKDLQTDKEEVRLYIEARKEDPKRYVPDPIIIKKSPRMYIREYVEYMNELEETNPNSKLVYEYDAFVIYMRKLLDMEDEENGKEIEI